MKIIELGKELPITFVDNVFSNEELFEIQQEIEFLHNTKALKSAPDTGVAYQDGVPLKNARGIFLDGVYQDREISPILKYTRNIFCEKVFEDYESKTPVNKYLRHSSTDSTLLNMYHPGQEYKPHRDCSIVTACFFLHFGEVEGGEFYLPELDQAFMFTNNTCLIFPSCLLHQAKPPKKGIRYSIAKFIGNKNEPR